MGHQESLEFIKRIADSEDKLHSVYHLFASHRLVINLITIFFSLCCENATKEKVFSLRSCILKRF